jgi:hypothetical protein
MWKYKGDLMPMIDNIRWTFVVNRMMRDDNDRLMDIMSDSDEMMKAAEEYGMTRLAVAKEMIRLGRKAIRMMSEED